MKNVIHFIFILSLFSLLGMFNAAFAAKVYVLGDPEQLPERHKTLPVRIRVVDRPTYGQLLIKLEKRSSMKGYTTNYPLDDSDNTTDMLLLKSDNSGWTDLGTGVLKYDWASYTGVTTFEKTVYVRCYDYGAWGTLKATLYKKTGEDGNGNAVYAKADSDIGTVPRDENGNHIADGWNNDFYPYKYSDATNEQVDASSTKNSGVNDFHYSVPFLGKRQNTVDKETGPSGNKENGDGFTVFEEYRGFMVRSGYHERFSPFTKEVGIVIHSSMTSYGSGDASSHPPSFTRFFKEYVNDPFGDVWNDKHDFNFFISKKIGWINSNSDGIPDTEYVYAVRIIDADKHPDADKDKEKMILGLANRYKPSKRSLINIYMTSITETQKKVSASYTLSQIVNSVIGHEVGHTVNLKHCPQSCIDGASTCIMDPYLSPYSIGASPSSYHNIDYDLAGSVKSPQKDAGKGRGDKKTDDKKKKSKPVRTLTPSDSTYTAEAGDSHTANFSTSSPYKSVYWYVKSPSDTSSYGTSQEIDQGDGSTTTASFTYTFPSGVSGDYKITSYVYPSSGDVYEDSYTVSVSIPTPEPETSPEDTSTTPPATLPVWSNIPAPYNLTVGDSFRLDLSSYVTGSPTITRNSGAIPAGLSFSSGIISGTVTGVESRTIRFTATNTAGSANSEWVEFVITSTDTTQGDPPVWSDIPDPYNLTVGDSFRLDVSSYVSGSPTLSRNGGMIPVGLRYRNGVVSGKVRRVESRSFRFTATNSAGIADSEWIRITVTAAQ